MEGCVEHAALLLLAQNVALQRRVVSWRFHSALVVQVVHSLDSLGKRFPLGLASAGAAPERARHLLDNICLHGVREHQLYRLFELGPASCHAQRQFFVTALRSCVLESVFLPRLHDFWYLRAALVCYLSEHRRANASRPSENKGRPRTEMVGTIESTVVILFHLDIFLGVVKFFKIVSNLHDCDSGVDVVVALSFYFLGSAWHYLYNKRIRLMFSN